QKQRKACAGYHPSDWSELFSLWCADKVSNLHVKDCLHLGHVYTPEELAEA
ncbi:hypothetical protein MELB17_09433, partial [Marinobacter sp. ELB17]